MEGKAENKAVDSVEAVKAVWASKTSKRCLKCGYVNEALAREK
jgi:transposase